MKPESQILRYAFRAAGAKLKKKGKLVTIRALSDEMKANFKTVQGYLYRNRDVANEIGLQLEFVIHTLGEYADAITKVPADQRPTVRRIAARLGNDYSVVGKYLKAHPELRALHPRFDKLRRRGKVVEPKPLQLEKPRRWKDLGVAVWDEGLGRYVGVSATKETYLDFWQKGLLKHQCEGRQKPEHLPTPEEVADMT